MVHRRGGGGEWWWFSERARPAEHSRGKHEDPSQEAQHTADRDTDQAKWKQENPDERIQERRQQSQRPADDQQNAPEEEFRHAGLYALPRNRLHRGTDQQPVLRRDRFGNHLRPDAVTLLLEPQRPHHIDGEGAIDPSRESARVA